MNYNTSSAEEVKLSKVLAKSAIVMRDISHSMIQLESSIFDDDLELGVVRKKMTEMQSIDLTIQKIQDLAYLFDALGKNEMLNSYVIRKELINSIRLEELRTTILGSNSSSERLDTKTTELF